MSQPIVPQADSLGQHANTPDAPDFTPDAPDFTPGAPDFTPAPGQSLYSGPRQDNGLPFGFSVGWVLPEDAPTQENIWLRFPADEIYPIRILSSVALHYWAHWYPAAKVYRLCTARITAAGPRPPSCPLCPRPASEGKPIASAAARRYILPVETAEGQRVWEFSHTVAEQLRALTAPPLPVPTPGAPDFRADFAATLGREPKGFAPVRPPLLGFSLLLSRLPPRSNGALVLQPDPEPTWGHLPTTIIDAAGFVSETWRRAAIREGKAASPLPF